MMRAAGNKSGGGRLTRLHAFVVWPINAERVGEFERANPISRPKPRANLDMTIPTIARRCRVRKWYTEYLAHFFPNIRPSLSDGARITSPEVGPLRDLLSSPPPKRPEKRFTALKAFAKRTLIAAYCHGLVSAKTTQRLIDKFELWSS